jgi:transposase
LIASQVTPADVQDRDQIAELMKEAKRLHPFIERVIADGGYQGKATAEAVAKAAGVPLEIVKRSDKQKGFKVLPKRWIVERTLGWLGRCRRLAKDFENLTLNALGWIKLAMIRLMLRRIKRLRNST